MLDTTLLPNGIVCCGASGRPKLISPPVGEMPGRAEGGSRSAQHNPQASSLSTCFASIWSSASTTASKVSMVEAWRAL